MHEVWRGDTVDGRDLSPVHMAYGKYPIIYKVHIFRPVQDSFHEPFFPCMTPWHDLIASRLWSGIHLFNFLPRGNSRKADDLALQKLSSDLMMKTAKWAQKPVRHGSQKNMLQRYGYDISVILIFVSLGATKSGPKQWNVGNFQVAFVVKYDSDVVASSFVVRCPRCSLYEVFTYMRGKNGHIQGEMYR